MADRHAPAEAKAEAKAKTVDITLPPDSVSSPVRDHLVSQELGVSADGRVLTVPAGSAAAKIRNPQVLAMLVGMGLISKGGAVDTPSLSSAEDLATVLNDRPPVSLQPIQALLATGSKRVDVLKLIDEALSRVDQSPQTFVNAELWRTYVLNWRHVPVEEDVAQTAEERVAAHDRTPPPARAAAQQRADARAER